MDPTIKAVVEQAFGKSHAMHLAQADRENSAVGNVSEQTKLLFAKLNMGNDLAESILSQRSAENQPQSAATAGK